jgi:hypothetical protein
MLDTDPSHHHKQPNTVPNQRGIALQARAKQTYLLQGEMSGPLLNNFQTEEKEKWEVYSSTRTYPRIQHQDWTHGINYYRCTKITRKETVFQIVTTRQSA